METNPVGRPRKIENPERLWELFTEYVEHERNNPMFKTEYVGKDGDKVNTPLQVPITFEGFECYLADKDYIVDLGQYSANREGAYEEFVPIIKRIRTNCFSQNFKGAAVGLFSATLISRKLGLVDKKETEIKGTLNVPNLPDIGKREQV